MEEKKVKKPRNVAFIVLNNEDMAFLRAIATKERTSVPRVARAILGDYIDKVRGKDEHQP